ncbi:MAG TPA: NUDIX domain-containing protein [Thermoplasmata archaeon]|nr:NUDIX domain-containing protein [Thermoplasmata archaeon]
MVIPPSQTPPPLRGPHVGAFSDVPTDPVTLSPEGPWSGILVEADARPLNGPGPPAIGGIHLDWLHAADRVTLDGATGTLDLSEVARAPVVTAFLEDPQGRVLLLKRSKKVGSFPEHWAAVSGFMEGGSTVQEALREVHEETGLDLSAADLVAEGSPLLVRESTRMFEVHPVRFRVRSGAVRIDWEHTEFEWAAPDSIAGRRSVPKLWEAWRSVHEEPPPGSLARSKRRR